MKVRNCSNCGKIVNPKLVRHRQPCQSCGKAYPYSITLFDNSY